MTGLHEPGPGPQAAWRRTLRGLAWPHSLRAQCALAVCVLSVLILATGSTAIWALRKANDKFQARFELMERSATAEGHALAELSAADLDTRWNRVKRNDEGANGTKGGTEAL